MTMAHRSRIDDGAATTGRRRGLVRVTALISLFVLAACGDVGTESTPSVVTLEPDGAADTAEIPDEYVDAVLEDAVNLTGSDRESIMIVRSEPAEWADARLGCVQSEVEGTDPVDGYWVLLETPGFQLDYRLDAAGAFRLCGDPIATSADGDQGHSEEPVEEDHQHEETVETADS